jgi:acyl-ACP thioesterase
MRTTITLDDDVAQTIKDEMRSGEGKTFKQAVNDLIRYGRYMKREQKKAKKPFKVRSFNMGVYRHLNYDNIGELLDEIEGPFHR